MIVLPPGALLPNNPRLAWRNLVTSGNVSVDAPAEPANPIQNVGNAATFLIWRAASTAAQTLALDLGEPTEVNYMAFARHNWGTAEVGYTIQGSTDGLNWTNIAGPVAPADDSVIIHEFAPVTRQFLRVLLGAGSVAPSLAVWYCGQMTALQRRVYVGHTPVALGRQTTVSTGMSESGQFLGRVIRRQQYVTSLRLQNLTPEWYRAELEPFAAVVAVTPFFLAWRPMAYPEEVAYCWAAEDPRPVNARPNGMMDWNLDMQGIVR